MRVILSGGGTGGHIYPALTIAKALREKFTDCDILFVGTRTGLEADIVPREGYSFKTIDVAGFERRLTWSNIKNIFRVFGSLVQSRRIIGAYKPDIVIGTGGYVCGPVLLAASLMGIPTMIQEQNVIPGVTNKILSRFVKVVAVGYADTARHFKEQHKIAVTGNPIRSDVMTATREEGVAAFGLDAGKITILVAGGSRGARSINRAMLEVYRKFAGNDNVQILHVTGQSEYNYIVGIYKQSGMDISKFGNIIIKPYLYEMPKALAAADLAIFRAGAIGLAELTARGVPSILIPYPFAAENHQEFNARLLERHGAALVIRDADLEGANLAAMINDVINNPDKLRNMAANSKKLGRPMAADHIAEIAASLIKA